MREGVEPTIGQSVGKTAATFEDALSSVNPAISAGQRRAVEQFNVAALNRAVAPLGDAVGQQIKYSGPAGREGVKAVGDILSDGYDAVKSQINLPITPGLQKDLTSVVNDASVTSPSIGQRVQTFLDAKVLNRVKNGIFDGSAFKDVEEALTQQARDYARSPIGDERKYAQALFDAADVMRTHLEAANPDQANILRALNKGWAVLTRIEDAVPTGSAEGVFTPFQLARSVEKADSSVRHRAYVRGEALLQDLSDAGLKVLGNKYPNSGTAGRTLAGLGVLGGAAALNPASAVALASSALAYAPSTQRILGLMVNGERPAVAQNVGKAIQTAAPYAGGAAALTFRP
jgi:hypothetical protein